MKKLIRRAVLLLAMGMLLLCCTGCVTGQIYGKPIDDMEDVDKAQGIMFGEKIMEIMNDGTLEELNELGYHNGLPLLLSTPCLNAVFPAGSRRKI